MTATAPVDVAAIVARLKEKEIALGDPLDIPRSTRAFEAFWTTRRAIDATTSGLMNGPADLARAQARLDACEARDAISVEKQASLEEQIAALPDWRDAADAGVRDRRYDEQQHLRNQLRLLREGRLLCAPDQAYDAPASLDQRIAELKDRRDRAQAALDGWIAEAERLLGAPVTQ